MHPLAMSVPVESAFAVPSEIGDNKIMAARLLSNVLGIPRDVLQTRFESGGSFVWILRKLPPDKAESVRALNLKGVYLQSENQRYYPKRELAAHVLGFVDLDEKGLGGIEYGLDSLIRGKSEKIVVMADARQRWFDGGSAQKDQGANVILTIDEKIQYIAERELAAAIAKTHAMAGTVIVQNPNNGAILALANWPKFNPNSANEAKPEARMDRAVSAIYEPGSTFKLITLAAALDQDLTRPSEVFNCENGAVYIAGHRIRDHKPFGMLAVSDILAKSSDVGAIKIALRMVIVITGSSNAVNLTDGLDGLAIGCTVIAAGALTVLTYVSSNARWANYLDIQFIPRVGELTVFCGALVGASLGFLWYNAHPAEVFMGDVGSLSLGGTLGVIAVIIKQEILLFFVGGIFVIEALSVILQVSSFKLRQKRIFRMAPIHHHFELLGWSESKVIVRFWILALVFALFALTTLKLR